MSHQYQILVTGPDLHLSTQLPQDKFELLLELIVASNSGTVASTDPAKTSNDHTNEAVTSLTQEVDLAKLFSDSNALRIPDKVAVYALHVRESFDQQSFTKSDLVKAFEQARELLPKNLTRDLGWALKIGWIAQSSQYPGAYYLTRTGEEAVRAKFPRDLKKKTSIHRLK